MRIIRTKIRNYRNLDNIEICLSPHLNFIVGENNLGKSNFLEMLDTLFNRAAFEEIDFLRKDEPIEIEFTLMLEDAEKGVFGDLFDPLDCEKINILAKQETPEDSIRYFHIESGMEIPKQDIRCINFIKYDSLRMPRDELTFYKNKGVGKFLSYLVDKMLEEDKYNNEVFINRDTLVPIIEYINNNLNYIRLFKVFGISADIEENIKDLIFRLLCLKDQQGFDIKKLGYGVQFLLLVVLSILEKIMYLFENKRFSKSIFEKIEREKRIKGISLVLGVDEPEIHLHPYMQRNLVKYIKNIITNKDDNFQKILKELFGLDTIYGQVIIVTHSPNIILDEYSEIIRFYPSTNKSIGVVSGKNFKLDIQLEKQLRRNMQYIKEALFSKCVVIVEGDTEFGALPLWANKILGDIDEYGVSFIRADSKDSIKPITNLMSHFNIPSVSIVDKDQGVDEDIKSIKNLIITNAKDFEEEIVNMLLCKKIDLLFEIVKDYDNASLNRSIQKSKLEKISKSYNIMINWENRDYKFVEIVNYKNLDLVKAMFLAWLDINKSVTLGRFLGEKIDVEFVPEPYKYAINLAKGCCEV
ncbi:ATP-dependent nuclease [Caldicellulosiruptor sp. DIB 104C]|uniref:ATP-dependent nuclease n=1 Tax=Caldicellulosiruptor sp. DIB 104C TaxID=3019889 RepID=UPI0023058752|nr:AAA family ATPase [Caldicellulosiruptor sp. DIB 104C]